MRVKQSDLCKMLIESVIAVCILGSLGLIGIILIPIMNRFPNFYEGLTFYLIALSFSTMVGDAILHLIPEALGLNEHEDAADNSNDVHHNHDIVEWELSEGTETLLVGICIFIGIWVLLTADRFGKHEHNHHHSFDKLRTLSIKEKQTGVIYMLLLSSAFHNIFDGLIISLAFTQEFGSGVATTMTVLAHELPHEFSDLVILIECGLSKYQALFLHTLVQFSALIGVLFAHFLHERYIKYILGFIAGNFLYLGLSVIHQMSKMRVKTKNKMKYYILEQLGFFTGFGLLIALLYLE